MFGVPGTECVASPPPQHAALSGSSWSPPLPLPTVPKDPWGEGSEGSPCDKLLFLTLSIKEDL